MKHCNSKSLYSSRVSFHLTTDAFVNSLFSRLAGCRLLHPLFQWHLGSELQPDVSVRQRGGVRPAQWKLHLLLGLEGGAVRPAVSREYGVTPAKAPGLRVRRRFISTTALATGRIVRPELRREVRLFQRGRLRPGERPMSLSGRLDG